MKDSLNLCIAGVNFSINCQDAVLQDLEPYYQSFYSKCENPERIDVRIYPQMPDTLNIEKLKKVFDSERSCAMFRNGTDYFIAVGSKGPPACLARFNLSFKDVEIYCNEDNPPSPPFRPVLEIINRGKEGIGGFEKVFSEQKEINSKKVIINPFCYPIDRLLMMYILSKKQGAMFHAAGIIINGKGYIFPGSSGTGKSTLSGLFQSDKGSLVLTDERVVVRKVNGKIKVFGTPWPGEAGIAVNKSIPLSGIFFIRHGTENKIKEIKPVEAMQRLLPLTSIPWYDHDIMTKILHFCENLISHVLTYELYFEPDGRVVEVLKEFSNDV